jgi:hypothetical protein
MPEGCSAAHFGFARAAVKQISHRDRIARAVTDVQPSHGPQSGVGAFSLRSKTAFVDRLFAGGRCDTIEMRRFVNPPNLNIAVNNVNLVDAAWVLRKPPIGR